MSHSIALESHHTELLDELIMKVLSDLQVNERISTNPRVLRDSLRKVFLQYVRLYKKYKIETTTKQLHIEEIEEIEKPEQKNQIHIQDFAVFAELINKNQEQTFYDYNEFLSLVKSGRIGKVSLEQKIEDLIEIQDGIIVINKDNLMKTKSIITLYKNTPNVFIITEVPQQSGKKTRIISIIDKNGNVVAEEKRYYNRSSYKPYYVQSRNANSKGENR